MRFRQPARRQDDATLVFAAASLKNALDAAVEDYSKTTGKTVTVSYAASSALAKQIEEGAPADIFFSADLAWMDYVQERNLIAADSRVTLLGNDIVLVAPADSAVGARDRSGLPACRRACAAASSPWRRPPPFPPANTARRHSKTSACGTASPQASRKRRTSAPRSPSCRAARPPLGIVYTTDAKADEGVKVVGTFPADSHPPILYPVALTANAKPDAKAFLDYLVSPTAKPFFEAQGFTVVAPGS